MSNADYRKSKGCFVFHNANPKGVLRTSDCVIRAIATGTGKSWEKVLEDLFQIALKVKDVPTSDRVFRKYFNITYLGQTIKCSLNWPTEQSVQINKIDMTSSETNQKTIEFSLNLSTSYPQIDERTESRNDSIIGKFKQDVCLHPKSLDNKSSDKESIIKE